MATHVIDLLNGSILPDSSGNTYILPFSTENATPQYDFNVLIFNAATTTKIKCGFAFRIPKDYVGSASFRIFWSADATSGDAEFDIEYTALAIGETADPSGDQETLNQNDAAPATAWDLLEVVLTPTASNFAVDDLVQLTMGRDDSDSGDTLSAKVIIFGFYFQYDDA